MKFCKRIVVIMLLTSFLIFNAQAENISDFGPITNSKTEVQRPGSMVWMDLLTNNVRKAAGFYQEVFDWRFQYSDDGTYAYATLNGAPIASIAAYEEELRDAEGLWLASISVPDPDAAAKKVIKSGGKIIEAPEDLPGRGRYVLVEDPTGAAIILLRATGGDPKRTKAANGWLWAELWTDDIEAATDFYEQVVGYSTVAIKDGASAVYHVMGRDQVPHASVVNAPLPDVDPTWLAYLLVDNVDKTARAVLKAGGVVLLPPQKDNFNSDVAIVADPTGGVFALQQRSAKQ